MQLTFGRLGVFTLAVLALIGRAAHTQSPPTDEGRDLYVGACAACHGTDAMGNGPAARELKVPPPDLTRLAQRHGGTFPREAVLQTVTGERRLEAHGTREMPVWSQRFAPTGSGATAAAAVFMRRQLEVLTDYIESLQRKNGSPPAVK